MDRFEVSNAEYAFCVDAGFCSAQANDGRPNTVADWDGFAPIDYKSDIWTTDMPVLNVSPAQAESYCAFRGGRLPTYLEWDVAARGQGFSRFDSAEFLRMDPTFILFAATAQYDGPYLRSFSPVACGHDLSWVRQDFEQINPRYWPYGVGTIRAARPEITVEEVALCKGDPGQRECRGCVMKIDGVVACDPEICSSFGKPLARPSDICGNWDWLADAYRQDYYSTLKMNPDGTVPVCEGTRERQIPRSAVEAEIFAPGAAIFPRSRVIYGDDHESDVRDVTRVGVMALLGNVAEIVRNYESSEVIGVARGDKPYLIRGLSYSDVAVEAYNRVKGTPDGRWKVKRGDNVLRRRWFRALDGMEKDDALDFVGFRCVYDTCPPPRPD